MAYESYVREAREPHMPRRACEAREKKRLSPVSLSVFSLVPDLLFDCSRLLEYAKIRTVLQSKLISNLYWVDVAIKMQCFDNGRTYLLKVAEENFFCQLFLSYNTSSSMLPLNVLGERRLGIASRWRKV